MKKLILTVTFAVALMFASYGMVMAHDNNGNGLGHGYDCGPGEGPGNGLGCGHNGCGTECVDGEDCCGYGDQIVDTTVTVDVTNDVNADASAYSDAYSTSSSESTASSYSEGGNADANANATGGNANATGGNADAYAEGGQGGNAYAEGGQGGDAVSNSEGGQGGQGGNATATTGNSVSEANNQNDVDVKVEVNNPDKITHKGIRGFGPAPALVKPTAPDHYLGAQRPFSFEALQEILFFQDTFTEQQLRNLAHGSKVKIMAQAIDIPVRKVVDDEYDIDSGKVRYVYGVPEEEKSPVVQVFISRPVGHIRLKGFVTALAKNEHTMSVQGFAKACLAARDMGGNAVMLVFQATDIRTKAKGWGIGFGSTISKMSDSESSSTVMMPSIGYNSGETKHAHFPWIKMYVLKVR